MLHWVPQSEEAGWATQGRQVLMRLMDWVMYCHMDCPWSGWSAGSLLPTPRTLCSDVTQLLLAVVGGSSISGYNGSQPFLSSRVRSVIIYFLTHLFLKDYFIYSKAERERWKRSPIYEFTSQMATMGQAVKSLELQTGLPWNGMVPSTWAVLSCFSRCISNGLDWKQNCQDWNRYYDDGMLALA